MPKKKVKKASKKEQKVRKKTGGAKKEIDKELTQKMVLKQLEWRLIKETAMKLFDGSFESRETYDWEWLNRDLFRRGYQFSNYDSKTRTVLLATRVGVKFPINLVWQQMRSVKNQVTNFKPKWEVLPTGKSEEAIVNADYSGRLLDYYYHKLRLRKMIKETVIQGLIYSVGGPWQIGFDPNGDNGNGEAYVWLLDPYDFYVDPKATSLEDAQFVFKAVRKNLDEIRTNTNYEFFGIYPEKGEAPLAASQAKQFLLQSLKHQDTGSQELEEDGMILKEGWIKIRVSYENVDDLKKELQENDEDADDLKIGEVVMRIIHYVDSLTDPLLVQLKRTDEFPFELYQADINPCEIYGESWAKHIIPINRVLNALESSVFTYNHRYAIGRIVLDKDSGVRLVSNQHGDFIEKNPGSEVTSFPLQPLPSSYEQQINHCVRYIEDLGGSHEVSRGLVPAGVKSGIGIAELKQADATNSADLVDNLEDFLENVGRKVLRVIADEYNIPKVIKDLGLGGDIEHFAVVGEKGAKRRKKPKEGERREVKIGADVFDLAVIGADNEVRVTIGSWLAYTKSAQQERLIEMFKAGLVDQKTVLKYLEFPDIQDIVKNVRKEDLLQKYRGQQAEGTDVSDEEIARQENIMIVNEGRDDVEAEITDNHTVHLIVHQEAMGASQNEMLDKHMKQHEVLSQRSEPRAVGGPQGTLAGVQSAQNLVPQALSATPPAGSPGIMPEEQALAETIAGLK